MKIAIDRNVPIPAYQQVVDGIATAIARGDLRRGSRLPSVRNLAVDLGLNVNTVARAYRDLERAGVIDTMPGMGTFVADGASTPEDWLISRAAVRAGTAARRSDVAATTAGGRASRSWQEMLAAAHALAAAEGVSIETFAEHAAEAGRAAALRASLLVVAAGAGEASDLLRALPADVAAVAAAVPMAHLAERLTPAVGAVLTTFPGQAVARSAVGERPVAVIPVETELTETTVRRLSELPVEGRLALVTVEKENWDQEANDVMKIVGRGRWLKMILLEGGERGLAERLENVDCVLHVPRARLAVEPFEGPGRARVELARQVTARSRQRVLQFVGAGP